MAKKIICKRCAGQGTVMGGGMMKIDCDDCEGQGRIYPEEVIKSVSPKITVIDRRSKSYKEAIDRLKGLHPDLTDDQVKDIFDKEYNKLD